jgi:hypothetical protein
MLPRAVGFLFTRFRQRQFREYVQIMTSYTPLKQEPHTYLMAYLIPKYLDYK